MTAIDPTFDAAVLRMAHKLMPDGFDVTPSEGCAPSNYASLAKYWRTHKRILVWSGASDATIFGDPSVNWAFRAWHDWCHVIGGHDFTLDGEKAVARMQQAHLVAYMVHPGYERLEHWQRLIWIEVVEQAEHFARYGQFPVDQRAFTMERLGHAH